MSVCSLSISAALVTTTKPPLNNRVLEAIHALELANQQGLFFPSKLFSYLLQFCIDKRIVKLGRELHSSIIKRQVECDPILASLLLRMYAACGNLEDADKVFNSLQTPDIYMWSAIILAHANAGEGSKAIELYKSMLQQHGLRPDAHIFVAVLKACATEAALCQGKLVHAYILEVETGWDLHMEVKNAAIDMFAKCGSLQDACSIFHGMQEHSVVTWSAMISAYAQNNEHQLALKCFNGMVQEGIMPNSVTFLCLLSACYHLGLVNEGSHHLQCMQKIYGIKPTFAHKNCLIELFGRTGQLKEAADLVQGMSGEADIVAWTSLLNQCKAHGNVQLAKECFDNISRKEPEAAYIHGDL